MAKEETALGSARTRFVEGLPRKAQELRAAVALLVGTPDADRPREELRRRLHALYASAQVFRIGALAAALKEAIGRLDGARNEKRSVTQDDLDALATLAATLPGLAAGDTAPPGPVAPREIEADSPPSPPRVSEEPKAARTGTLPPAPVGPPDGASEVPKSADPSAMLAVDPFEAVEALDALDTAPPMPPLRPARSRGSYSASLGGTASPSRHPTPLSTVLSVLVVDRVEWQTKIRGMLPAERFELVAASDPEAALRLARTSGPDVVLLDHGIMGRDGADFISRLHSDPLTDFVPVIVMLPEGTANDLLAVGFEGADESIGKPFDRDALYRVITRVTGAGDGEVSPISGNLTASELADRLADELRRGIADAAEHGREVPVPIGDGSAVLAAAWSAIARVRAHLTQESGGKVRFRDGPRRGGPALMALFDEGEAAEDASGAEVSLSGRRVIVADDDPAVVWFFAGLLREEGADVFEADDGRAALEEARRHRPDVIISDILMPELDGFGLCRALERDPSLSDVPVILLSWKEDFLQRMRDLHAGARGYLRKEAGTAQILARVREVLRPRARLEAQLATGAEVRGRSEGLGVVTLLRTVAKARPDARVVVRDAWNLFEVDVRGGDLVDLTCTATDGSFARGPKALLPLLGVTSARFTVDVSETPVMRTFKRPLSEVLADGCAHLGAIVDSISGKSLPMAAELDLDRDALSSFLRTSPAPIQLIVQRLADGRGPRELLMSGEVAPGNLESALIDLARRGAILAVRGSEGEDRVALAVEARREGSDVAHEPPIVPPEGEDLRGLEDAAAQRDEALAFLDRGASQRPHPPTPPDESPKAEPPRAPPEPTAIDIRPAGALVPPSDPERISQAPGLDPPFASPEPGRDDPSIPTEGSLPLVTPRGTSEPTIVEPVQTVDESLLEGSTPAPEPEEARELARLAASAEVDGGRPPSAGPAAPAEAEESSTGFLGWLLTLLLFGVAGFAGMTLFGKTTNPDPADPDPTTSAVVDSGSAVAAAGRGRLARDAEVAPPPTTDEVSYGETLPYVDAGPNLRVPSDHGLVIIQAADDGPQPEVFLGTRSFGRPPIAEPLPEGTHELRFHRGDEDSYRYVHVRAGQTRVLPPLGQGAP